MAETTTTTTTPPAAPKVEAVPWDVQLINIAGLILPFILIFYLLIIRPQRKQEQKKREMLDSLQKDDKIVTIGGILGSVANIAGDEVTLRVDDKAGVKIRVTRSAVATILKRGGEAEDAKDEQK